MSLRTGIRKYRKAKREAARLAAAQAEQPVMESEAQPVAPLPVTTKKTGKTRKPKSEP